MTTTPDLDQARKWAKSVSLHPHDRCGRAAAEVIDALPDTIVDGDKLWEVADNLVEEAYNFASQGLADRYLAIAKRLHVLLSAPAPRTLADIPWDDNVHPYMEAVTISGRRHILLAPMGDTAVSENTILVAEHDGGMPVLVPAEHLFPTGRYARLSMPDEHPADAEGRPEPDQPRPEDAPVKEPWLVEFRGERHVGTRESQESPYWALARMDGTNIYFADDHEVTLVSRLVPEGEQAADEARRALDRARAKQELHDRRYTTALTNTITEVTQVYTHWTGQGHDPVTAAILTQTTLDNLPEGL